MKEDNLQLPEFNQRYSKSYGELYDNAYIAYKLIAVTRESRSSTIPLHESLIINIKNDKYICENSKKVMLDSLENGKNVSQFNTSFQSFKQDERIELGSKQNKIKFNPTSITSTQIFRFSEKICRAMVIHGFQGIGKSFNTIFLQYLSNFVIDFIITIQTSDQQEGIKLPWQYLKVKKIFILNVDKKLQEKQVLQLLTSQFTPIQMNILRKFINETEIFNSLEANIMTFQSKQITLFKKMMGFFKKFVNSSLIFQKINEVVGHIKSVDYKRVIYEDYREKTCPTNTYTQIVQLKQHLKNVQYGGQEYIQIINKIQYLKKKAEKISHIRNFQEIVYEYRDYFFTYILLSSMNVERRYLQQIKFNKRSSQKVQYFYIDYFLEIQQNQHKKMEIISYLLEQLQHHRVIIYQQNLLKYTLKRKSKEPPNQQNISNQKQTIKQSFLNDQHFKKRIYIPPETQKIQPYSKQHQDEVVKIQNQPQSPIFLKDKDGVLLRKKRPSNIQQDFQYKQTQAQINKQKPSISKMRQFIKVWIDQFYCTRKRPFILTPLQISKFIKIKQKKQQSFQIYCTQNVFYLKQAKQKITFMICQIQHEIRCQIIKGLSNFIKNENNESAKLVKIIFLINVLQYINQNRLKFYPGKLLIKAKQFRWDMSFQCKQFIRSIMDRNLFTIQHYQMWAKDKDLSIRVSFAAHLLLQTQDLHLLNDDFSDYLNNYDASLVFSCLKTRSGAGSLIENLLFKAILASKTIVIMKNKNQHPLQCVSDKNLQFQTKLNFTKQQQYLRRQEQLSDSEKFFGKKQQKFFDKKQQKFFDKKQQKFFNQKRDPLILNLLKDQINSTAYLQFRSQQIKFAFQNINPNKGQFKTIPKRNTKEFQYSITVELMTYLHEMSNNSTKILEPIKRSKKNQNQQIQFDESSKSIDFILVKKVDQKLIGFLIDVTIKFTVQEKLLKFISSYQQFADRNIEKIDLEDQTYYPNIYFMIFVLQNSKIDMAKITKNLNKKIKSLRFNLENISQISVHNMNKNKRQLLQSIFIIEFSQIEFFSLQNKKRQSKLFKTLSQKVLNLKEKKILQK